MLACLKGFEDIRIHFNHKVLLPCYLLISFLDDSVNPLLENWTNQGVDDVGDVPSRELVNLALPLWQQLEDLWERSCMLKHRLYRQPFKVGYIDGLHFTCQDPSRIRLCQIPQIPNSH